MATDWIDKIPSIVFSRVLGEFSEIIKDKYKMDSPNFSGESLSDAPPIFPFVHYELLPPSEEGQDLEGTSINGGLFTFQFDVYDNLKQQREVYIMSEIVRIMKSMSFSIPTMPYTESEGNIKRRIARFRRMIGAGDKL